jgi:hypothetical protein
MVKRDEKQWSIYTPKKWQREKGLTGQALFYGDQIVATLGENAKMFFPRGTPSMSKDRREVRPLQTRSQRRK